MNTKPLKVLFFANTDWFIFNFLLELAKHLRTLGIEVVMVSPAGAYGEQLEHAGFRWVVLPMERRSLNPFEEVKILWHLLQIYRAEQPDIAHHFTIKCVVYGGLVAHVARIRNVVSAITGLGYVFIAKEFLATMLRPIVRALLKIAINGSNRRLILENPDDRQLLLDERLIKEKYIRVIAGLGVNTTRFKPKTLLNRNPKESVKVFFAARLLWDKGLGEFIDAAKMLRSENINAEFFVAGVSDLGNPAAVSKATLDEWRLLPGITFLGHISTMAEQLSAMDIMVLPSYREGLPRSLIEAASVGLPIVTTDVPGCRQVVEDGINGFLVPVRDRIRLADAMRKLIIDPELAIRMGVAGRQKALAEFDERIVFEKTVGVYHELNPHF